MIHLYIVMSVSIALCRSSVLFLSDAVLNKLDILSSRAVDTVFPFFFWGGGGWGGWMVGWGWVRDSSPRSSRKINNSRR